MNRRRNGAAIEAKHPAKSLIHSISPKSAIHVEAVASDQITNDVAEFVVRRVSVDNCRQRRGMPSEPLSQEQVATRPVDIGDGRVPCAVERVQTVKAGP